METKGKYCVVSSRNVRFVGICATVVAAMASEKARYRYILGLQYVAMCFLKGYLSKRAGGMMLRLGFIYRLSAHIAVVEAQRGSSARAVRLGFSSQQGRQRSLSTS